MTCWINEINLLKKLNNNKIDKNIFQYVIFSSPIYDFYENQLDVINIVKECYSMIIFVKKPTYEIYKEALSYPWYNIVFFINDYNYIDTSVLTQIEYYDICISIFRRYQLYHNIDFVNYEHLSNYGTKEEILKIFLIEFGYFIRYIDNQTEELCLYVVNNSYFYTVYDLKIKTFKLCCIMLSNHHKAMYLRQMIDNNELLTKQECIELCCMAVNHNYQILKDIDNEFRTDELLKIAILKSENAIDYIYNPTEEIILLTLQKNINKIKNIKNKTFNICKYLANNDYTKLKFVSKRHMLKFTYEQIIELYNIAYSKSNDKLVLQYFNKQFDELRYLAINNNYNELYYIKNQTLDICKYAVNINQNAVNLIINKKIKRKILIKNFNDLQLILLYKYKIPKHIVNLIGNCLMR